MNMNRKLSTSTLYCLLSLYWQWSWFAWDLLTHGYPPPLLAVQRTRVSSIKCIFHQELRARRPYGPLTVQISINMVVFGELRLVNRQPPGYLTVLLWSSLLLDMHSYTINPLLYKTVQTLSLLEFECKPCWMLVLTQNGQYAGPLWEKITVMAIRAGWCRLQGGRPACSPCTAGLEGSAALASNIKLQYSTGTALLGWQDNIGEMHPALHCTNLPSLPPPREHSNE